MSLEANKSIVQKYFTEVVTQGKFEHMAKIMSMSILGHDATSSEPKVGLESVKQVILHFRSAFADLQVPIHDIMADGDKVIVRWGLRGTHQGTFMGVSATGKYVDVGGIMIFRLEDEKIVEYWGAFDVFGLMGQIGAR